MKKQSDLDKMMLLASKEYEAKEIEEFLALDTEACPVTPQESQRAEAMIRAAEHRRAHKHRAIKYIAVACLIALAVSLTACMLNPRVRAAIGKVFEQLSGDKKLVIQPHTESEGYILVSFGEIEEESGSSDIPDGKGPQVPTKIEARPEVTYLPEGYTEKQAIKKRYAYGFEYYYGGQFKFHLDQSLIDSHTLMVGCEGYKLEETLVQGHTALLGINTDEAYHYLVWQTDKYEYMLFGEFSSLEELMKIAEGIKEE